ncbi:MAG TPA: 50S ribosomal protein L25 [Ignavibacteriales bacterium]|mgnify:FL=1|nr:50S ribosomal protein L25 [Ignavibacteriales bacterium]HOM65038.1 50S ribosomal protein L25 [Ignavibacteriales bacterium]HPD67230.1 50S ribosomal protein L25 [Ignavibacteriales bacterium]HPP34002.1 50S ribosomal protein L25 [Ignavibacteriales bacterium]HRR17741.1 50S ribosomal protein L25 [Ignavibacteriales bacterium]
MKEVALKAQVRVKTDTKSSRRSLRRQNIVPGVFYGKNIENINIALPEIQVNKLVFTSEKKLVNLEIENKGTFKAILKDFQLDPVTDRVVHFDFQAVQESGTITVEVPVLTKGQSVGVKEGGILQIQLHQLNIECEPSNLPEHIELDVTNLKIGDSLHVGDVAFEGIKILHPKDAVIVTVVPPKGEESTTSDITEPEVISKGKKEE